MMKQEGRDIYRPLDVSRKGIRILHIEDGLDEDGRVQCRLKTVHLAVTPCCDGEVKEADEDDTWPTNITAQDETPFYEAISWTWGKASDRSHIRLDGTLFEVPKNADTVLRQLCVEQEHRTVWLDAVCINQDDVAERGHQVAIMKDVYSRAARVLVWLGEADDTTEQALASIDKLVAQCTEVADTDHALESLVLWEGFPQFSSDALPACDWKALEAFFNMAWFSRVWVVQEVMLGTSATCFIGRYARNWLDIVLAAQWLYHRQYQRTECIGRMVDSIDSVAQIWRFMRGTYEMVNLLFMSIYLYTTLPHDQVYGMLGLLQVIPEFANIVPDYDMDLATLYANSTKAAMASRSNQVYTLSSLEYVNVTAPRDKQWESPNWPTWVHKYHRKEPGSEPSAKRSAIRMVTAPMQAYGHAANLIPYQANQLPGAVPTVLETSGWLVDRVDVHTTSFDESLYQSRHEGRAWVLRCQALARCRGLADHDVAITLTGGSTRTYTDAQQDSSHFDDYRSYIIAEQHDQEDTTPRFLETLWTTSWNRVFFVTKKGYIGLGPPDMKEGDCVCILQGARLPSLLRRQGDHWILLGTTYLNGVMSGEHIQKLETEGRLQNETQSFEIH